MSLRCHETSLGVGVVCNLAVVLSRWTRAEGPKCECAVVQSALVLWIWIVTVLPCRLYGLCRGATDLAFVRATLQSAMALRMRTVAARPYDPPSRNVSEMMLRCQHRRGGSGVSLGCRVIGRVLWVWIVPVLPYPPPGRCGSGVLVRRCAIGTSTMDLKCRYAVV